METRMARLSDEEIEERLAGLDAWERAGDTIRKQFDNGDFKGSVEFVNRLTPRPKR
jgi:pterin-4a-carbinolamine dehydratase